MVITSDDYLDNREKVLKETLASIKSMRGADIIIPAEQIEKDRAKFRECYESVIMFLKQYVDLP